MTMVLMMMVTLIALPLLFLIVLDKEGKVSGTKERNFTQ
jgi:hypothetical protein